jgi:hypothetical protein
MDNLNTTPSDPSTKRSTPSKPERSPSGWKSTTRPNTAPGIVMADRRCTAEEAFRILVKVSQDTNRKLRDVATTLVNQAANPAQQ